MRDRRVHSRYDVSTTVDLNGKTNKNPSGERLMTFSIAGCGFWSLVDEFRMKIGDVLECEFRLDNGEKIHVHGAVLYTNPYPLNGVIGRYYGIRFLGDYESKIRPILQEIEARHMNGKISLAQ